MDLAEAARLLGVAESEIREFRDVGGRLEVLHHDMASHEETWRSLPGGQEQPELDSGAEGSSESGSGDERSKPAPKRKPRS